MTLNPLRLLATLVVAGALAATPPAAATTSLNYSDLWSTTNEQGWGINISQQADTLFVTLFVYDGGETAVWYSATLTYQSTSGGAARYGGTLYQTSGSPFFAQPYNPAILKYRDVGLITIDFGDDAHGLLNYTVNGAGATKQISRLTFAPQNVAGKYIGSTQDITYGCANPSLDNRVTTDVGPIKITQSGASIVIEQPTCKFTGTYTQQGQIGRAVGDYTCTNGSYGFLTFSALQAEKGGMTGTYTGSDPYCLFRGNIGAMRELD